MLVDMLATRRTDREELARGFSPACGIQCGFFYGLNKTLIPISET
jgi:hypothetical protein